MKAENIDNNGCPQRDSAEHEGYAEVRRSFRSIWKERDSAKPELLEEILERDNLNRAFKRVKARKGAPGIDGMTIEEAGAYFRENKDELIRRIKRGKYTPDPVKRVEIPKPDGGIRKLGIPTVKDRVFQQAITQNNKTNKDPYQFIEHKPTSKFSKRVNLSISISLNKTTNFRFIKMQIPNPIQPNMSSYIFNKFIKLEC